MLQCQTAFSQTNCLSIFVGSLCLQASRISSIRQLEVQESAHFAWVAPRIISLLCLTATRSRVRMQIWGWSRLEGILYRTIQVPSTCNSKGQENGQKSFHCSWDARANLPGLTVLAAPFNAGHDNQWHHELSLWICRATMHGSEHSYCCGKRQKGRGGIWRSLFDGWSGCWTYFFAGFSTI